MEAFADSSVAVHIATLIYLVFYFYPMFFWNKIEAKIIDLRPFLNVITSIIYKVILVFELEGKKFEIPNSVNCKKEDVYLYKNINIYYRPNNPHIIRIYSKIDTCMILISVIGINITVIFIRLLLNLIDNSPYMIN